MLNRKTFADLIQEFGEVTEIKTAKVEHLYSGGSSVGSSTLGSWPPSGSPVGPAPMPFAPYTPTPAPISIPVPMPEPSSVHRDIQRIADALEKIVERFC